MGDPRKAWSALEICASLTFQKLLGFQPGIESIGSALYRPRPGREPERVAGHCPGRRREGRIVQSGRTSSSIRFRSFGPPLRKERSRSLRASSACRHSALAYHALPAPPCHHAWPFGGWPSPGHSSGPPPDDAPLPPLSRAGCLARGPGLPRTSRAPPQERPVAAPGGPGPGSGSRAATVTGAPAGRCLGTARELQAAAPPPRAAVAGGARRRIVSRLFFCPARGSTLAVRAGSENAAAAVPPDWP